METGSDLNPTRLGDERSGEVCGGGAVRKEINDRRDDGNRASVRKGDAKIPLPGKNGKRRKYRSRVRRVLTG